MKIGEFSRRLGVTAPTVRFYETLGLIPPARRSSGRRLYDQDALHALRIVLALKRVGFTLVEIKSLLVSMPGSDSRKLWHRSARAKLAELNEQISELRSARRILQLSFDCECEGRADRCGVISLTEDLGPKPRARRRGSTRPRRPSRCW
jgi:DNA-binding transcriptional MerR regulator